MHAFLCLFQTVLEEGTGSPTIGSDSFRARCVERIRQGQVEDRTRRGGFVRGGRASPPAVASFKEPLRALLLDVHGNPPVSRAVFEFAFREAEDLLQFVDPDRDSPAARRQTLEKARRAREELLKSHVLHYPDDAVPVAQPRG